MQKIVDCYQFSVKFTYELVTQFNSKYSDSFVDGTSAILPLEKQDKLISVLRDSHKSFLQFSDCLKQGEQSYLSYKQLKKHSKYVLITNILILFLL